MNDPDGSDAPGAPSIPPTWSSSDKNAVGTSHDASRVWFTFRRGILNEVYGRLSPLAAALSPR